jgi:hypothetical protein
MITLEAAKGISLAKIATLRPEFAPRVLAWFDECWEHQLYVYIYEGYRSRERQEALYKLGRDDFGNVVDEKLVVTKARAGQSFHNYGLAIDWVPLLAHPKALNTFVVPIPRTIEVVNFEAYWDGDDFYAAGQAKGVRYELRNLSWETPHLEDAKYPNWRALAEKYDE